VQALALVDLQIAKAISMQLFIPAKNGSREIGALNPLRICRAVKWEILRLLAQKSICYAAHE